MRAFIPTYGLHYDLTEGDSDGQWDATFWPEGTDPAEGYTTTVHGATRDLATKQLHERMHQLRTQNESDT